MKLERPEARREVYLPERGPSGPPTISFKQYHALVDVPCYVCFDMECYRNGNGDSLAHVASSAYAAVGSDVYTVPEEHRYRVFKNYSENPVQCVIDGIKSLQELWRELQAKSQLYPQPQADGGGRGGLPGRDALPPLPAVQRRAGARALPLHGSVPWGLLREAQRLAAPGSTACGPSTRAPTSASTSSTWAG